MMSAQQPIHKFGPIVIVTQLVASLPEASRSVPTAH